MEPLLVLCLGPRLSLLLLLELELRLGLESLRLELLIQRRFAPCSCSPSSPSLCAGSSGGPIRPCSMLFRSSLELSRYLYCKVDALLGLELCCSPKECRPLCRDWDHDFALLLGPPDRYRDRDPDLDFFLE